MNFRKTLSLVGLAITLPLASCATTSRQGVVVTNCVSDPLTESLHCVDVIGLASDVPWKESGNYVCRPPAEDQKLFEATRLK